MIASNINGTVGRFYRGIGKNLIARGHKVYFVTQGAKKSDDVPEGCTDVFYWPSARPVHLKDVAYFYKLVKKYSPDAIISNFGSAIICLFVGFLCGVKHRIHWYHTPSLQMKEDFLTGNIIDIFRRIRLKCFYKLATRYLCATKYTADDLVAEYAADPKRISIFPFLLPSVKLQDSSKDANQICFVGRFHPSKRQHLLISAMPLILKAVPAARAVFVGKGPLLTSCIELAKRLNVFESCSFIEHLPTMNDIYHLMATSALKVVASSVEGFGLVVTEALSVGCPLVVSDIPAFREILRDGQEGFFFDGSNIDDLARNVIKILENKELREQLSRNAKEKFLKSFSIEQNAEKYAASFEALIS